MSLFFPYGRKGAIKSIIMLEIETHTHISSREFEQRGKGRPHLFGKKGLAIDPIYPKTTDYTLSPPP